MAAVLKPMPWFERLHLVPLVDAANRHHRHQHVHRLDQARVAREQRLDEERLVRLAPRSRSTSRGCRRAAGRLGSSTISLTWAITMPSRNAAASTSAGVSSVLGAGVEVAVRGPPCSRQTSTTFGRQVDQQPGVQFDVGVDRADFEQAVFQQLRDAQALGAGEGEVELARDAPLEQVQMLGAARRWG